VQPGVEAARMRRALTIGLLLLVVPGVFLLAGAGGGNDGGDYKVRAIFDNASFLIGGQDVKVAGAKVGVVEDLDVTPDHKAAVVLNIQRDGFKDFRQDAHCEIRLQSVIGEKLVACEPTQPRQQGEPEAPPLEKIPDGQPGAGQHLLPVSHTGTPVDADLINNIQRLPFRQRLSILLNEFGAGLASRAEDLRELIRRGDPALKEVDDFFRILAEQNRMLKRLTGDADTIFKSLAKNRKQVADFFVQSRVAAQATAEKRADLERNFQKFPPFLRQLRPFMERFAELSAEMAPVVSDLRASGPDVSRILKALGPFSTNSAIALKSLGNTADIGRPALVNSLPIARQLSSLASTALPVIKNLRLLLTDLQAHKGIERFLDLLYNQTLSFNGFDEVGHYLRNNLIVTICSGYSITPTVGCSANFQGASSSAASSRASVSATARRLTRLIGGDRKPKKDAKDTRVDKHAAKTPSASKPAPERPSSTHHEQKGDGLMNYLLGGTP
jgi:phospholipid/cholesterol/gamma-HCH transport system substrate-binding protein